MKYIICVTLGLWTASAGADSWNAIASPSQTQIQEVEQSIGSSIPWPEGAKPIDDYDRYYYWNRKQTGILQAQFRQAKRQSKGKTFSEAEDAGYVVDGGCSVVNLTYFGKKDPRNQLRCGGR